MTQGILKGVFLFVFACSIFVGGSLLLKIWLPNILLIDFIASLIIGFLSEAAS